MLHWVKINAQSFIAIFAESADGNKWFITYSMQL